MSHSYEDVGSLGNGHPLMETRMNTPTIRTGEPPKKAAAPKPSALEGVEPKVTIADISRPQATVPAEGRLVPKENGLFPVRILRHYRPMNHTDEQGNIILSKFRIVELADPNDEYSPMITRDPTNTERLKVWAGTIIYLPPEEAERAIRLKIAERADDWKL